MPLPRLPSPRSVVARLMGWLKGASSIILLFTTVIFCNGLQMLSTALIPFSRKA